MKEIIEKELPSEGWSFGKTQNEMICGNFTVKIKEGVLEYSENGLKIRRRLQKEDRLFLMPIYGKLSVEAFR